MRTSKRIIPWLAALGLCLGGPAFGQMTPEEQPQAEEEQQPQAEEPKAEEPRAEEENIAVNMSALNDEARKQVQAKLQESGHYKGEVDGKIGPETKDALLQFQKEQGLVASGEIDVRTARALDLELFVEAQPVAGEEAEEEERPEAEEREEVQPEAEQPAEGAQPEEGGQ